MKDVLGYDGKRVVVTGAASGIGRSAAQMLVDLGAEVYALDIKAVDTPVEQTVEMDLRNKAAIDDTVSKIPDRIDALFNCAGLPGPPFSDLDTALVNFVGHRHLTEALLPRIPDGGAIAFIASLIGMGWQSNLENVGALLATRDFQEALGWLREHPELNSGYVFSKQCIIAYTKTRAGDLAKRNIRINSVSPAITDTPMMKHFHNNAGKETIESFMALCGRYGTPEDMAGPIVLLNSDLARFVSGQNLFIDFGFMGQIEVGQR